MGGMSADAIMVPDVRLPGASVDVGRWPIDFVQLVLTEGVFPPLGEVCPPREQLLFDAHGCRDFFRDSGDLICLVMQRMEICQSVYNIE